MRILVFLTLLVMGACGSGSTPNEVLGLRIEPASVTLVVTNGAPVAQSYQVFAIASDGAETDVTSEAVMSVTAGMGAFFSNTLSVHGVTLGRGVVQAAWEGEEGVAEVIVQADDTRVDPGVSAEAPSWFDAATPDPSRPLTIAYPPAGVVVPRNLGDLDVHWQSATDDVFEITLTNAFATLRVIVPGTDPAHHLRLLPQEWSRLVSVEPTLSLSVRGLRAADPATVSQSPAQSILASNEDMSGGIYFWSTSSAGTDQGGFWRHDMADAGQGAESYLSAAEAGQCVGCHALSRDGERMLVVNIDASATLYDVASKLPVSALGTGAYDLWAFHPSGQALVAQRGSQLVVHAADTGAVIGTTDIVGNVIQPDFTPQGDRLIYVADDTSTGHHVVAGPAPLMQRTYDAATATFGPPTPVYAPGDLLFYPTVSPDGQWIAFNRAPSGSSASNPAAEVWVVNIDGTRAIRLMTADQGANLTNSWARWAPFEQMVGGERTFWLTFSSSRPFGVMPGSRPQIWMAAFAADRAAAGVDPSSPAFRLPFQDLQAGNHIGQWTEQVVDIE